MSPTTTSNKLSLLALSGLMTVAACASPTVVERKKVGDSSLTCDGIRQQIAEADEFKRKADETKGVNTRNVLTAVVFWPAVAGTYYNSKDAIKAADERKSYLVELAAQRQCPI